MTDDVKQSACGAIDSTVFETLLHIVQDVVLQSNGEQANTIDCASWLSKWLNTEVPALGWRTPRSVLANTGGIDRVSLLLRTLESGAYQ